MCIGWPTRYVMGRVKKTGKMKIISSTDVVSRALVELLVKYNDDVDEMWFGSRCIWTSGRGYIPMDAIEKNI